MESQYNSDLVELIFYRLCSERAGKIRTAYRWYGFFHIKISLVDRREIQPLMQELKNQSYTTAHLAAEVIGKKGYTKAISLLQKQLDSNNYYLSSECMVALARLGHRESIQKIRDMLINSNNPRLIIHAASALEIFGDTKAVPALIEKLKIKTSPFLRDEIILSIAGIVGMEIWFYPFYIRFLESATEGISLLMDYIRKIKTDNQTKNKVQDVITLITRRDRTAFAKLANNILVSISLKKDGVNLSDCFNISLNDNRLLRLDRFCFLTAALIVWSLSMKSKKTKSG